MDPIADLCNIDPTTRHVGRERARQFAEEHGAEVMEVSAKTGENIDDLFNKVCDVCHHFVAIFHS